MTSRRRLRTPRATRVAASKFPVTLAIRALRESQVSFEPHLYPWQAHGGTAHSAAALGVDEHSVIKALIFEDEHKQGPSGGFGAAEHQALAHAENACWR